MVNYLRRVGRRGFIQDTFSLILHRFMIVYCTFGTVQSFGVYQDYYTVLTADPSHDFQLTITTLIACVFERVWCLEYQLGWFYADLPPLCRRSPCWKIVRRWLLPSLHCLWISHLSILVSCSFSTCFTRPVHLPCSIFMLSLAQPHHYYQVFLSQGVGMGIGMGMLFLPAISVTSHYFRRRRTVAMGVVISGWLL